MTKRLQRGALANTHPFWLRALAAFCLLFVSVASSAQAVHIHGDWLPHHAAHVEQLADGSQVPGGEEHCPLCVAMHSALPIAEKTVAFSLTLVICTMATAVDRLPDSQWHFAQFSRPPPVVNS